MLGNTLRTKTISIIALCAVVVVLIIWSLLPVQTSVNRRYALQSMDSSNLRQILISMQAYKGIYGEWPINKTQIIAESKLEMEPRLFISKLGLEQGVTEEHFLLVGSGKKAVGRMPLVMTNPKIKYYSIKQVIGYSDDTMEVIKE